MSGYDKPRTLNRPWLKIVLDADPTFFRDRTREVEYEFTRRKFYANTAERGIYGLRYDFSDEFEDAFENFEMSLRAANGF